MLDINCEEELVKMVGGKFRLTSLIQKRIVELNRGSPSLVEFEDNEEPTLRDIVIKEILEGKHDDIPAQTFYMAGTIDEVVERSEAQAGAGA